MKFKHLLDISLSLFDGGASAVGGDGAGAAAPGADTGAKGDSQAIPGSTRRGKSTGDSQVLYGKQARHHTAGSPEASSTGSRVAAPAAASDDTGTEKGQAQPSVAGRGKEAEVTTTSNTLEDKRKAFQELVNGEYKDIYTEETQRIINRRFRETQNLEQQIGRNQPVIDMLMQRYKIGDGDISKLTAAIENDDAYWSAAAEEAGMRVEQYKQLQKLQRENAALVQVQRQQQGQQAAQQQLQKWYGEAQQVQAVYPGFDLGAEIQNQQFLSLLKSGVPVQHAYEVIHMEDIKAGVAQTTAKQTEKQVVDGIRAKGARPAENGTASQSAFTVKDDVSKLTKSERAEIARRVARGENISF